MEKKNTDEYLGQILRIAQITNPIIYIEYEMPKANASQEDIDCYNTSNQIRKNNYMTELVICSLMCERFRSNSNRIPQIVLGTYSKFKYLIDIVEKFPFVTTTDIENEIWESTRSNIDKFYEIKNFYKKYIKANITGIIPNADIYNVGKVVYGECCYHTGVEKWYSQGIFDKDECKFILFRLVFIIQILCKEYNSVRNLFTADTETELESNNQTKNKIEQFNTISDLFTKINYLDYLDILTQTEPPLLKRDTDTDSFTFIGSKTKQRGCIGAYFKYLKIMGIINQNANRDTIAKILSSDIRNFTINGASIDNQSKIYDTTFESQIKNLLAMISKS